MLLRGGIPVVKALEMVSCCNSTFDQRSTRLPFASVKEKPSQARWKRKG